MSYYETVGIHRWLIVSIYVGSSDFLNDLEWRNAKGQTFYISVITHHPFVPE